MHANNMPGILNRWAFLGILVTCMSVTGCDAGDPGEEMIHGGSITGIWRGTVPSRNVAGRIDTFRVELQMTEDRTRVSGQGTVTGSEGAVSFTVADGSYFHPLLSLQLLYTTPTIGDLKGNVADDRLRFRGTMSGPGFSGTADLHIILARATQ